MPRSPIPDMIERFHNLTQEERKCFLDLVDPQPEPEPPAKQTRKKRTTKSAKAQSLESAIKSSQEAKAEAPLVLDGTPCTATVPGLDVVCGETADKLIHDPQGGYAGYHPFEASAPAQPAEKKSRRKAATANSTPNSVTNSEGALAVGASGD